jgi:hypothetical protein
MHTVATLFDLVAARPSSSPRAELGRSQRLFLAAFGLLCAIGFAAIWGLAVSGAGATGALANAVKVPMLLIVSGVVSLPAVLLFWKLTSAEGARASDLFAGYAVAVFGGTLVLAALSPLVALYVHSSSFAGPRVAIASAVVALAAGTVLFARALERLLPAGARRRTLAVPVTLMLVAQLATLSQLASVVSPVFGHRTSFGRGIDGLGPHAAEVSPEAQP